MSSHRKRVIYESDDEAESTQPVDIKRSDIQNKRIICDSDDETDRTSEPTKIARLDDGTDLPTDAPNGPKGNEKADDDCRSDDEWDPDAQRNVMEAKIPTPQLAQTEFSGTSSEPFQATRMSQRSAAIMARTRLRDMSPSAYSQHTSPVDSLQSLSRPRRSSAKQKKVEEDSGDERGHDEDASYKSSTASENESSDGEIQYDDVNVSRPRRRQGKSEKYKRMERKKEEALERAISTRSGSDRSRRLSAAKDAQRETIQKEMRRFSARQSALDALDALSSEEEASDGSDAASDIIANSSRHSKHQDNSCDSGKNRIKSQKSHKRPPPHSQSRSSSGSSAFIRSEMLPQREASEDEDDAMGAAEDDFIVGSDEERDEQQKLSEAYAKEREKRHRRKEKERKQREAEKEKEQRRAAKAIAEAERAELERVRELHNETSSKRRRIVVEDDEDEDERDKNGIERLEVKVGTRLHKDVEVEEEGEGEDDVEVLSPKAILAARATPDIALGTSSSSSSRNRNRDSHSRDSSDKDRGSQSSGKKSSRRSRHIIVDSSDEDKEDEKEDEEAGSEDGGEDEKEEEDEEGGRSSKSRSKTESVRRSARNRGSAAGQEDGTEEENDEENDEDEEEEEEEDEEDEDDDDESLDGPMLYRRVDALREKEDEEEGAESYIRKVAVTLCYIVVLEQLLAWSTLFQFWAVQCNCVYLHLKIAASHNSDPNLSPYCILHCSTLSYCAVLYSNWPSSLCPALLCSALFHT